MVEKDGAAPSQSLAEQLASGESNALSFDFTDDFFFSTTALYGSMWILDAGTPANDTDTDPITGGLTVSGSPKMLLQSDGNVKYAPHNLCQRSKLDSVTTGWAFNASNVTLTAGADDLDGGTGAAVMDLLDNGTAQYNAYASELSGQVEGRTYFYRCYVKAKGSTSHISVTSGETGQGVNVTVSDGTKTELGTVGNSNVVDEGDGWYRVEFTRVGTSTGFHLRLYVSYADATTDHQFSNNAYPGAGYGVFIYKPQITTFPADTSYVATEGSAVYGLPIEWNSSGTQLGMRVEEQRTNLILDSSDLDTAATWSAAGGSMTADNATSPSGETDACLITANSSATAVAVFEQQSMSNSTQHTISCYFKAGTEDFCYLSARTDTNRYAGAVFDVSSSSTETAATQTAATGSTTVDSTKQEDVGNGWFRSSLTFTTDSLGSNFIQRFGFADAATGNSFTSGAGVTVTSTAGTETFFMWGPQFEEGSSSSSYIDTGDGGATVTRSADDVQFGTAWPQADANVTMFANFNRRASTLPGNEKLLQISGSDEAFIRHETTLMSARANAGALIVGLGTVAAGDHKVAVAFETNNAAGSIDGGTATTDTSGAYANGTAASVYIGQNTSNGENHTGLIKQLMLLPRRMADGDLETLAT